MFRRVIARDSGVPDTLGLRRTERLEIRLFRDPFIFAHLSQIDREGAVNVQVAPRASLLSAHIAKNIDVWIRLDAILRISRSRESACYLIKMFNKFR